MFGGIILIAIVVVSFHFLRRKYSGKFLATQLHHTVYGDVDDVNATSALSDSSSGGRASAMEQRERAMTVERIGLVQERLPPPLCLPSHTQQDRMHERFNRGSKV